MTDLSPDLYDAHPRRSLGDAVIFYSVFCTLFVVSLIFFSVLRVFGRRPSGGVIKASRRAANGPAGYAVNMQ